MREKNVSNGEEKMRAQECILGRRRGLRAEWEHNSARRLRLRAGTLDKEGEEPERRKEEEENARKLAGDRRH